MPKDFCDLYVRLYNFRDLMARRELRNFVDWLPYLVGGKKLPNRTELQICNVIIANLYQWYSH